MTFDIDADALAHQSSLDWRKSSLCPNNATCVEVATLPGGGHAMRDGKDVSAPHLEFDTAGWSAFLTAVRAGEFNPGR